MTTSGKSASVVLGLVVALLAALFNATPATGTLAERVGYIADVQSIGWQPTVYDGGTAGTTGRALRLEAFRITTPTLMYRANVQGFGW